MPALNQAELVLVHDPLAGDLFWQPVAGALRVRGRTVSVPSLTAVFDTAGPYYPELLDAVARRLAAPSAPAAPVVLAGHSAAGALLPALRELLTRGHRPPRTVAGTVYVDAPWPLPGRSGLAALPPEQAARACANWPKTACCRPGTSASPSRT